ncbi:MAG: SEC-C metal-binding domain-containing protein [Myxococcota bacterium]
MGHAIHFLQRLERIGRTDVELGMSLYNDPELVHTLLARAKLPDQAERIAIALRDPVEGPFIIVTRQGQFVTCLGEGMTVGDLPVITRERLDGISEHIGRLRQRIREAEAVTGSDGGQVDRLLDLLLSRGMFMRQAEYRALRAWQPILYTDYWRMAARLRNIRSRALNTVTQRHYRRAARLAQRRGRPLDPTHKDVYKLIWEATWACHHLTALNGLSDERQFKHAVADPEQRSQIRTFMAWSGVRDGITRALMLDLWGVARLGKAGLKDHKRAYRQPQSYQTLLCTGLSLLTLGMRHRSLQAEAFKTLRNPPPGQLTERVAALHQVLLAFRPDNVTTALAKAREQSRNLCDNLLKDIEDPDNPFSDKADLMRQLKDDGDAPTALITHYSLLDFRTDMDQLGLLLNYLPWLAQVECDALFLPEKYMPIVETPWHMELTQRMIDNHIRYNMHGTETVRYDTQPPKRNDPCPCGSGKKYKRCCLGGTSS